MTHRKKQLAKYEQLVMFKKGSSKHTSKRQRVWRR